MTPSTPVTDSLEMNPTHLRPTHEMILSRTTELASMAGREAHHIRLADYVQAKRELTGETCFGRQSKVSGDNHANDSMPVHSRFLAQGKKTGALTDSGFVNLPV